MKSLMATYAIGDVQGCFETLQRLTTAIAFDPARDRLWFVGDLVNRGPRSLETLRWVRGLGDRAVTVLGNHDLHLLRRAAGVAKAKPLDTLRGVLDAPDRDLLIDWLRARPLIHAEDGFVLVHAGLHPDWSVAMAGRLAEEITGALAGADWKRFVGELSNGAQPWKSELRGVERVRAIMAFLVRVRTCSAALAPVDYDGPPEGAPPGAKPWYALPGRAWADHVALFGHWAAHDLRIGKDWISLDSGCVWGRRLSAVRLEDRAVFQVESIDPLGAPD
jgi:bis(5'-nucleosyl)-tetraphosphatase (symmetrical)